MQRTIGLVETSALHVSTKRVPEPPPSARCTALARDGRLQAGGGGGAHTRHGEGAGLVRHALTGFDVPRHDLRRSICEQRSANSRALRIRPRDRYCTLLGNWAGTTLVYNTGMTPSLYKYHADTAPRFSAEHFRLSHAVPNCVGRRQRWRFHRPRRTSRTHSLT